MKMNQGLKDLIQHALEDDAPAFEPVRVSPAARVALSGAMRRWTGWKDCTLEFGDCSPSPAGRTQTDTHTVRINIDALSLNPHRVINTVTQFRLKQEAIITGVMLHEAAHARHSLWDGVLDENDQPYSEQEIALARLMEEPRIEGIMAREANRIGAVGLAWTMRAAAAHITPMTDLDLDPTQALMQLITSWALRAGRQHALGLVPQWRGEFDDLLRHYVAEYLKATRAEDDTRNAHSDARVVHGTLILMTQVQDDEGRTMCSMARDVLRILFPETEAPTAQVPCSGAGGDSEEGGDSEGEGESESGEGESDQEGGSQSPQISEEAAKDLAEIAKRMADKEAEADKSTTRNAEDEQDKADKEEARQAGLKAGEGGGFGDGRSREPTKSERELAHGAESFLKRLVNPTETTRTTLSNQPSAIIDGAAYSAWKASGQVRTPTFFKRTHRVVTDAPPVEIAILVDVSESMSSLQKPSAILSWALASAATDMANFAGRGQKINSMLIHWGNEARVVQAPGEPITKITEHKCDQGTTAMHAALALVEANMPGFFDLPEDGKAANRLLVQFTDWELWNVHEVTPWMTRALEAGVNMLSVVPRDYTWRRSALANSLKGAKVQRGRSSLLKYDPRKPEVVWSEAAQLLERVEVSGNLTSDGF